MLLEKVITEIKGNYHSFRRNMHAMLTALGYDGLQSNIESEKSLKTPIKIHIHRRHKYKCRQLRQKMTQMQNVRRAGCFESHYMWR